MFDDEGEITESHARSWNKTVGSSTLTPSSSTLVRERTSSDINRGLNDDNYSFESLHSIDSKDEKEGVPKGPKFPVHKLLMDMT